MAQGTRQSELFAAQDWTVIYRALSDINFNASDPPSINAALRAYIQKAYPEDFNDWITSSEFVAIIDLISWVAGTLAYKTDINARENFLETAEAQESILRLARFLSYNASRNMPARGLLKLSSVSTDNLIYDSFGNSLQNLEINWNDPNDPDWYERLTLILNDAFISTNPFGAPIASNYIGNVPTYTYRLNSLFNNSNMKFSSFVAGSTMDFEIINMNVDSVYGFVETPPNPQTALQMVYRSDGLGNTSNRTGFFMGFKQGISASQTFNITTPVENQTISISATNINQSDVWVQTVDDTGKVLIDWSKVPALWSDNITYTSLPANQRNIFSAITQPNDSVMIRFSDGRFGNAPVGNIKVSYRQSNGLNYIVRPVDMSGISISIPYKDARGSTYNLKMTFDLVESVSNSSAAETINQIKTRAPQVYSTQNRMVSGNDYNSFPLQSPLAKKVKSLNRVYSGQSRFIDLNDPTDNYSSVNIFGDDGSFYIERNDNVSEVAISENKTPSELIDQYINPAINSSSFKMFMSQFLFNEGLTAMTLETITFTQTSIAGNGCTGFFTGVSEFIASGANLKIQTPSNQIFWTGISTVNGSAYQSPYIGTAGPVILTKQVPTGSTILQIIPAYNPVLPAGVLAQITTLLQNKTSFSLWYDYTANPAWTVGTVGGLYVSPLRNSNAIKVFGARFLTTIWRFASVGTRYSFESSNNAKFFFDGSKTYDLNTGLFVQDNIKILSINTSPDSTLPIARDYSIVADSMVILPSGIEDNSRIAITFGDEQNGFMENPDIFYNICISENYKNNYLFWILSSTGNYKQFHNMNVFDTYSIMIITSLAAGSACYVLETDTFYVYDGAGWNIDYQNYRVAVGRGPNVAATWVNDTSVSVGLPTAILTGPGTGYGSVSYVPSELNTLPITGSQLYFQWKHYASTDKRIDPSVSNIVDMFVLTSDYDYATRLWIAQGADVSQMPVPPTAFDLKAAFSQFETYKMFSDQVVWRPAKYKFLFGNGANPELQAQFKIVVLPNATMSNGEIKSTIVNLINTYFQVDNWDFGEIFYFTELTAYIHQQLSSQISSCVIVPIANDASFGDNFQVYCRSDEIFISTASVSNVIIIDANTPTNLRIK